ncbi:MAG: carboxypeptidase-like regulatory domain-containing protein [Bryobacteraceae bacterium]
MWIRRCVLYFAAWPVLACSCASYEPVKACQIFHSAEVIFRGRAIDHNDDRSGRFDQVTLYRFRVIEAFKGVPPGVSEVFIDPGSGTSCYRGFEPERDHLVFTGILLKGQTAAAFLSHSREPAPAAWKALGHLPVYSVWGCNPTRTVSAQDPDLEYLRSMVKSGKPEEGWIEGRAVQNFSWQSRSADFVAASDAQVSVRSTQGVVRTASAAPNGTFVFSSLAPGPYTISVQSRSLGQGGIRGEIVNVRPGGCAVAVANFLTNSTVSGRVFDSTGKPASDIRMELGELLPDGKVRDVPSTWANTDRSGNFTISNAPVGRIVLAANLNGAPTPRMPFDPYYAPGVQQMSQARVFDFKPGENLDGVTLRLPPPLPFADLYVDVVWPDGTPAVDMARAVADWGNARAAYETAPNGSRRVKLRLVPRRKYKIRASWIHDSGERFLYVGSTAEALDFTKAGQVMTIPLKSPRPE